jgi:hypothetical protein
MTAMTNSLSTYPPAPGILNVRCLEMPRPAAAGCSNGRATNYESLPRSGPGCRGGWNLRRFRSFSATKSLDPQTRKRVLTYGGLSSFSLSASSLQDYSTTAQMTEAAKSMARPCRKNGVAPYVAMCERTGEAEITNDSRVRGSRLKS